MRDVFTGFYDPTAEDLINAWNSENTLFVFDTSTLLNLYSYAQKTRNDFFLIIEQLKGSAWIPYQVAIEYQRRRLGVIKEEKAVFVKLEDALKNIESIFSKEINELSLKSRFPTLHTRTKEFQEKVKKSISDYKKSVSHWDKKQPCVRGHDSIRDRIDSAFENNIGVPPTEQKWLDDIYEEGKKRYENNTPPGFKDQEKEKKDINSYTYAGLTFERQYGDLVLWKETLERAANDDITAVILVTDDTKEDWWYSINSRGEKQVGPRAELRQEISDKSSIETFMLYNTADFLSTGKNLLKIDVSQESVDDAENTLSFKRLARSVDSSILLRDIMNELPSEIIKNQLLDTIKNESTIYNLDSVKNDLYTNRINELRKEFDNGIARLLSDTERINIESIIRDKKDKDNKKPPKN